MMPIVHAIFAYALSYAAGGYVLFAIAGSVIPDIDALFVPYGEIHRTFLHTPISGLIVTFAVYYLVRNKKTAASFFMGWISHLLLDTLTVTGVMWAYPLSNSYTTVAWFRSVDPFANFFVIAASLVFLSVFAAVSKARMGAIKDFVKRAEQRKEGGIKLLAIVALMSAFSLLFTAPVTSLPSSGQAFAISSILERQEFYDGKYVTASGNVSMILESYTSKAGVFYQIFMLNDGTGEIRVFKSASVEPSQVAEGDMVFASGLFSTDRNVPEIRVTLSIGLSRIQSKALPR